MQLTWLGHSCFLMENGQGTRILTDPCDPETGYDIRGVNADIVTVSHSHHDHCYVEGVAGHPVLMTTPGVHREKEVRISGFSTWHDDCGGAERGGNIAFLFELDGIKVLHLGDLGHEIDPALVEEIGPVDVLLCPVGGVYTIDGAAAKRVVAAIQPSILIPMHFQTPALTFSLDGLDRFLPLVDDRVIHRINGSTCTIGADSLGERRLLLMRYKS